MSLSEHALHRALERAGLEAPVRFDEVTGSTNDVALELAEAGAPEWTLVAAAHQTAGRGRSGRSWSDVAGSALMFSLVLRPDLAPELAGLLPLLAGASMALACRVAADAAVRCKWPNDLLLAGGRKVGGILAESVLDGGRFRHVVMGIGVNLGDPPAGIVGAAAIDADAEALLDAFLDTFARHYEPAHPAFAGAVAEAYRHVCITLGHRVAATTRSGSRVEGEAIDVDETGALVLRTENGLETVRSGEVEHLEV